MLRGSPTETYWQFANLLFVVNNNSVNKARGVQPIELVQKQVLSNLQYASVCHTDKDKRYATLSGIHKIVVD